MAELTDKDKQDLLELLPKIHLHKEPEEVLPIQIPVTELRAWFNLHSRLKLQSSMRAYYENKGPRLDDKWMLYVTPFPFLCLYRKEMEVEGADFILIDSFRKAKKLYINLLKARVKLETTKTISEYTYDPV